MSEREEMFSGDDVEESSSSLGYSPSDYSVPSEDFQELVEQTNTYRGITDQGHEETTVFGLQAPQLTSRGGETIDTLVALDRAHSLDQAKRSLV